MSEDIRHTSDSSADWCRSEFGTTQAVEQNPTSLHLLLC